MTNLFRYPYFIIRPLYERTNFHKSVISEIDDNALREAYAHCRFITRKYAKTFYMATRFLPNHKQRSIFAIYGLCRYLDDLVDEAEDLAIQKKISHGEILEKLEEFKSRLIKAYNGNTQNDPILTAFSDTLTRFEIDIELPLLLLEGVTSDLTKKRYADFDEVYDYSYKVASVVGLMTSQVFGYKDKKALEHAVELGIAMQLTNILRDVGEDLQRGRIYLPQADMKQFGVSEGDLFDHKMSTGFIELMQFQINRTRQYYNSSDSGIPLLEKDSRLPVALARQNYSRILDKIEENGYNVFGHRAYLNSAEKMSIIPKVLYSLRSS